MDNTNDKIEIRNFNDGSWCWMPKSVIQEYAAKIGSTAIAVYSFLSSLADNKQKCFPSQKYISQKIGYSRGTINRAIKTLVSSGLIRMVKKNQGHCIYFLLRVKSSTDKTQLFNQRNPDVSKVNTNDNSIERNINNNDIDSRNSLLSNSVFNPRTREEMLALDLAKGLEDLKGIALYISYSRKYPEHLLRSIMSEVKAIPDNKIKKGRGALFNHLVKQYVKNNS